MARRVRLRRQRGDPRRSRRSGAGGSPAALVALPAQICNFYGIETDGINDYVDFGVVSPWNTMLASALGYSIHMRLTINVVTGTRVIVFGGASGLGGLAVYLSGGRVVFVPVYLAGEPSCFVIPPAPGTYDLTFVYDRPTGVGSAYLDGVPGPPSAGTPGIFPVIPASSTRWAAQPPFASFPFDGVYQRVAMFARPLSQAEITTLVAVGTPCGADWRNPYGNFLGNAAHYYPCGDDAPGVAQATDLVAAGNGSLVNGAAIVPLFP